MQIENYNEPFLDSLREYDDVRDLSDYDFSKDDYGPPYDDPNKRKLAYRHRMIGQKYEQVLIADNFLLLFLLLFLLHWKLTRNLVCAL